MALIVAVVLIPACGAEPDTAVLGAVERRPAATTADAAGKSAPSSTRIPAATAPVDTEGTAGTTTVDTEGAPPTTTPTGSEIVAQVPVDVPIAPTISAPAPSPEPARVGAEAETLIAYPFRTTLGNWTITYAPAREGVRGLTFPASESIEIYVRPGDTAATVARVLAHELGHALDVEYNSDEDRQRWRDKRDIDDAVPWWPTETTFDFDTAAGDWAEAFAVWQTGATNQTNVAGPLAADDVAILQALLP